MTTERTTKEILTRGGHKVWAYVYATGGECNTIDSTYLEGAKITVIGGMTNVENISPNADDSVKDKKVSLLVVSVDGETDDILNRVNALPHEDYDEVLAHLNGITKKKSPPQAAPK